MPRSIASLSLSFGLVSIPVKVYAATESTAALRFKLLSRGGARVRRQYVAEESEALVADDKADQSPAPAPVVETMARAAPRESFTEPEPSAQRDSSAESDVDDVAADEERGDARATAGTAPVPRGALAASQMVKGYEFEKGRFVTFTDAELKALAAASRSTIDIVEFIPERAVDPVYYDKAYYLAPDRQGARPYSLLRAAMQESRRTALAKWAWRAKEYVVQIRPVEHGLLLQQLLYAEEVRPIEALHIELAEVSAAELALALRLVEQISDDVYHPDRFVDEEKQRILAAVERKIAGRSVLARPARAAPSAQVIDLVAALRASLDATAPARTRPRATVARAGADVRERKPARRATNAAADAAAAAGPKRRRRSTR